jgi:hypothetical protein
MWTLTSEQKHTFLFCFSLTPAIDSSRILGDGDYNINQQSLSNEYCAQMCHDADKKLAGTEYGTQCFCGNQLRAGAIKVDNSECSMPCQGYSNETCGNAWRLQVFTVNCSGTPVPPPPEIPFLINPCLSGPFSTLPFCNYSLSLKARGTMICLMLFASVLLFVCLLLLFYAPNSSFS